MKQAGDGQDKSEKKGASDTMENQLDRLLAAYCSPALAGIKPANLVSCDRTIYPDLPEQLETYREAVRAARNALRDRLCVLRTVSASRVQRGAARTLYAG